VRYTPHKADNGVYAFVLDGEAEIDGQPLQQRDGLGLVDVDTIDVKTHTDLHLLLIEVPML
jgi:redox-sensitive bicupin YhaK (pirin superfamily)